MLKKIAQRDPPNPSTQQKPKSFSLQYHISSNRHGLKDIWDLVFIFIRGSYVLLGRPATFHLGAGPLGPANVPS